MCSLFLCALERGAKKCRMTEFIMHNYGSVILHFSLKLLFVLEFVGGHTDLVAELPDKMG